MPPTRARSPGRLGAGRCPLGHARPDRSHFGGLGICNASSSWDPATRAAGSASLAEEGSFDAFPPVLPSTLLSTDGKQDSVFSKRSQHILLFTLFRQGRAPGIAGSFAVRARAILNPAFSLRYQAPLGRQHLLQEAFLSFPAQVSCSSLLCTKGMTKIICLINYKVDPWEWG